MDAMGMSQTNVFPAEGPFEPSFGEGYDGPFQRPRDAAQLTEGSEADENAAPRPDGDLPEGRYLDREESWLRFHERVLELAEDESIPLLERVRSLAIFASNLDEFFMVRVAGLMRRMVAGFPVEGAGSQMASQVLRGTLAAARVAAGKHAAVFRDVIQPAL